MRAAVADLDAEPLGTEAGAQVDLGAGVQQRVGDDLADQQDGGLDEVLATGIEQQAAHSRACLGDAGRLR